MTADAVTVRAAAPEELPRLLPLAEATKALGISEKYYKQLHREDPDNYPAERIGILWRVPAAYVQARAAWPREKTA